MKKLLLFVAMLMCLSAHAQHTDQPTATLQVGEQTSIFYGKDAFKSAFAAAPDEGGVIILSSGVFETVSDINKSVSIYGAGFENDTISHDPLAVVPYTKITGGFNIVANSDGVAPANIYLEGLCINDDDFKIKKGSIEGLKIVKCSLRYVRVEDVIKNSFLRQCHIYAIKGNSKIAENLRVENCWIAYIDQFPSESTISVDHCIMSFIDFGSPAGPYNFSNCYFADRPTANGGVYYNCIINGDLPHTATGVNCWYRLSPEQIFGTNMEYQPHKTWKLLDPASYVGNDGTEVGLYGGNYPWNKIPSTPRITESKVDVRTSTDGHLKVTLKAEARPVTE